VAGSVKARLLLQRRLGRESAQAVAAAGSLPGALRLLAGSTYGRAALAAGLESAQREVAAVTLLRMRILAAWLPLGAVETIRSLAAWFELANIEDRLAYLEGGDLLHPFDLGSLGVAWPRLSLAQTAEELRDALAGSTWAYGGGTDPREVHTALRFAWAERVLATVPEASRWAGGAVALLLAREMLWRERWLPMRGAGTFGGLVRRLSSVSNVEDLRTALPAEAAWALDGVATERELWRAEARWWRSVESEAEVLARAPRPGRSVVVGVVALLAADAARTAAALGVAARGGAGAAKEALDALL
jgi:hypothetical protein